ncbi:MAG: esterase-like activity of phytase family protein [Paracoccaceae bacterium]
MLRSVLAAMLAAGPAGAETVFSVRLVGHAVLPAATFSAPPPEAPRDARISGKFAVGPGRVDAPGAAGARPSPPFAGQPLQGISGFATERARDGSIFAVLDNGFGSRANSPDALLSFVRMRADVSTGAVEVTERVWLRDPDRVVPFRIAYEGSEARHLTGADFDPESIQVLGETVWIGEEFGPHLIRATLDGVVTGVFAAELDGRPLRSPDHPALRIPAEAGRDWRVPRSGGFEGLGLQPGTGLLWAMAERPILTPDGDPEAFLRAFAFDPAAEAWTGESLRLRLAAGATAIGDLTFVDEVRALVIERDGGEGDPSLECDGPPAPDCFAHPARLKRVVLIDIAETDADGFVRRIGHVDLMDLEDPDGIGRVETDAARDLTGRYTLPFATIESVTTAGEGRILVAVDNNLPFSTGRRLGVPADTEVVLLEVRALLAAE